jgi:VIT1/CCC1 family predicted Fe2+/Mn2+ transporter
MSLGTANASIQQLPSKEHSEASTMESASTRSSHSEKHAHHGLLIRDSIIGFADGLTVPFALTAGLSALGNSKIVVLGGLAELFAGSISMGLGAYLAAVTERKHYMVEEVRERREVREKPAAEEEEIYDIFQQYGIGRDAAKGMVECLKLDEDLWVKASASTVLSR